MSAFRSQLSEKGRLWWIRVPFFASITVLLSSAVFAGEPHEEKDAAPADAQIQIVADKLVTNNAENFAEFVGDVRASQGDLVMTSDRLRIYYEEDPQGRTDRAGSQGLIKQIVASGGVQVSSEKYRAETDRVEYDLDTQVLVFIGENSTVTSGKNILTGSKITVYRKSGQMKVESSPQKRVRAVFYHKEKAPQE